MDRRLLGNLVDNTVPVDRAATRTAGFLKMNTVTLNSDESVDFRIFDAELRGYVNGAAALADQMRRRELDRIVNARPKPAPTTEGEQK